MLLPINFLIGLGLLGAILLATRWARVRSQADGRLDRAARDLRAFSPLGNLLLYPLEQRFPPWDAAHGAPDGIVVLGGSIDADLSAAHGEAGGRAARPTASSRRPRWRVAIRMRASSFPAAALT